MITDAYHYGALGGVRLNRFFRSIERSSDVVWGQHLPSIVQAISALTVSVSIRGSRLGSTATKARRRRRPRKHTAVRKELLHATPALFLDGDAPAG